MQEGSESMFGFMRRLNQTGCWYGAVMVAFYAVVVPAIKLASLIGAEVLRLRSPRCVHAARWLIITVQMISKWASPDMFAYVLLMYLMCALDHPPMIGSKSELDVGFTCFALYCVFSTIASLGIEAPDEPAECVRSPNDITCRDDNGALAETTAGPPLANADVGGAAARHIYRKVLFPLTVFLLFGGFIAMLAAGVTTPVMSLRIDVDLVFEPTGKVPIKYKDFILSWKLEQLIHSEVTLGRLVNVLAAWGFAGDANYFLAFVLLAGFAIVATVLDMVMLVIVAHLLHFPGALAGDSPTGEHTADPRLARAASWAYYLKKVTMLDVAVAGIVAVTLCGVAYRKSGTILSMELGLLELFFAEVSHYALYHLVMHYAKPILVNEELSETGESVSETTPSTPDAIV